MTVIDVAKDPKSLTMTITAEFDATPDRIWQLWADPRQLERWWGPPGYPATFVDHEMRPGSLTRYFMTTPEGEKLWGWWKVRSVAAPHRFEFEDGFADSQGDPNPDAPVGVARITIESIGEGRTRMSMVNVFASTEDMEQVIAMGMEEGIKAAMGQIEAILATV